VSIKTSPYKHNDFSKTDNADSKQLSKDSISTDLYPLIKEYSLVAFELELSPSAPLTKVLNQLTYALQKLTKTQWASSGGLLLTEHFKFDPNELLSTLWKTEGQKFRDLLSFREVSGWIQKPKHSADYVAKIFNSLPSKLECSTKGDLRLERKWWAKGIVIDEQAYLAIELSSSIRTLRPLNSYELKEGQLIGLEVKDFCGNTKGEIIEIVGLLKEHRTRLLSLTKTDTHRELIKSSSGDTIVVKLKTKSGFKPDYILPGLVVIVRPEIYNLLNLNSKMIRDFQQPSPQIRREIITNGIEKSRLSRHLGEASNSETNISILNGDSVGYSNRVMYGKNMTGTTDQCFQLIRRHGFYKVHQKFSNNLPVKIYILNLNDRDNGIENFKNTLSKTLSSFGFKTEFVGTSTPGLRRFSEIEELMQSIDDNTDIVLGILPDDQKSWFEGKQLTINSGRMSQMVTEKTVLSPAFKIDNLAIGLLSKLGNVPWVLENSLTYCDVIMGADVARMPKENGKGTRNTMGIPRWFSPNGDLLKYKLIQSNIDGEMIPMEIIRECTPAKECRGKNILFHLDGKRPRDEVRNFLKRGTEIDAEVMVVEIIKEPLFRCYNISNENILPPKKGNWVRISSTEAVVVSTVAAHGGGTPQPLHIKCTPNISIENAVHSVLVLSNLNYASKQQTRCPVTTQSSHNISKMLLYNIKPPMEEGNAPWWL